MSKVKIQGNASGSGTLTIEAPNTDSNRTISLPDSTGTLVDTNSSLSSSKLTGALPAIDGSALTNVGTLGFGAEMSSNTSVSTSTWTKLGFDNNQWDTNGSAYSDTNKRFTVPTGEGGRYMFTVQVGLQGGLDNGVTAITALYRNGVRDLKTNARYFGDTHGARMIRTDSWIVNINAGDYIEVYYLHEDSETLTIEANRSRFTGFKIAD